MLKQPKHPHFPEDISAYPRANETTTILRKPKLIEISYFSVCCRHRDKTNLRTPKCQLLYNAAPMWISPLYCQFKPHFDIQGEACQNQAAIYSPYQTKQLIDANTSSSLLCERSINCILTLKVHQ